MRRDKTRPLLIISAHADDHVACAGTVLKLSREHGFVPFEVVLTNSELGQDYRLRKEIPVTVVARTRNRELAKASKFLGIRRSFLIDQPDLGLSYSREVVFEVAKIIRQVRPRVVFLHNEYDAHPDHKVAFKIGLDASKVAAMGVSKEALGKPFRVPLVLCAEGMLPIKTQILVDVTRYKDKRDKLFSFYASQASTRAMSFETALATVRGYHLRKKKGVFAEAFTLQEEFPVLFFEDEKDFL